MLDKQLDLHTHLSKVYIHAIPVQHTLMRQLFRQQAHESIGGDATEFVAVGLSCLAGPQRGRQGRDLAQPNGGKRLWISW